VKRLLGVALLIALVVLLAGCSESVPQNTFGPQGDVAQEQRDLLVFWVLGPAAAILVLVEGVLVYALIRYRHKRDEGLPQQVRGNTRLEVAWTIAPAILLFVIAVPTIGSVIHLGREPANDALQVRVTGRQWAWEFEYLDPEYEVAEVNPLCVSAALRTPEGAEGKPLCVLNELHIPVDREIAVSIESFDVVHSFWVPRLAGKLDAIPGRTNRMWFNATSPGAYSGQCAEFCGLGHADMRLRIIAETEEEFQQWIESQLEDQQAAKSGSGEAELVSSGE